MARKQSLNAVKHQNHSGPAQRFIGGPKGIAAHKASVIFQPLPEKPIYKAHSL